MNTEQFLQDAKKTAKIVDALHKARYAMVVVDGNTVICERSEFKLNFKAEIDLITDVMTLLGIDMTQPLPAPVNWRNDDESKI